MKCQTISLMALLLLSMIARAQYVSVPDTSFGAWLDQNGFDSCMIGSSASGWQLDTTCPAVTSCTTILLPGDSTISSVEGIEYFKGLKEFTCSHNTLTSLPRLPDSLLALLCFNNHLDSLPTLPNTLTFLDLYSNNVHTLPVLPQSLHILNCIANPMDTFIPLPVHLTYFSCGDFPIKFLPALPASLISLACFNASLDSLPTLPDSLNILSCYNNELTVLPPLPATLRKLNCDFNQLTVLPAIPDSMYNLSCAYNRQLACLPHLHYVVQLNFDSTAITCLPDTLVGNTSISPSNVPICNATPCTYVNGINDILVSAPGLNIYPNPTQQSFTMEIDAPSISTKGAEISVINMMGQEVMGVPVTLQAGNNKELISLSEGTSAGIYVVQLTVEGQSLYYRLVLDK